MSISAISSSSATSQLSYLSSTTRSGDSGGTEATRGAGHHRRPEGGGLVGAIASALQQIGVSDASGSKATSTDAATAGGASDDASATQSSAQALGGFLQALSSNLSGAGSSGNLINTTV
ncbi:hypothetical protein ACFOLJ_24045 [Rugamonas sp. CCM 8940]|uniref:hypothetical protein n=1 Tax=Rugamonas sp. CCM 8940 TaxID=2765359 RepID=UPI0018F52DDF|nr:hypothetical protein [Rugamonas sp. CCM 8940]MBJ7309292.1 hypothetical protein [Rugamonas sp. CCM 8940]